MNYRSFRLASGILTVVLFMGAIIGSATGNAGAGIGAAVGLLGGALIGDQMQARQKQEDDLQRRMAAQQAEIERANREIQQLKAQQAR